VNRGIRIPYETADSIAVATMRDALSILREEVRAHIEDGDYMHPDDYVEATQRYIPALEIVIEYYGGEDDRS
jgi:hypothetical protein